ncbi:SRPBCC domain-containing protein [Patulibacter minatonensis]|uniref:SRPBCC domain-containing protein n=1 Tax=Patulibacter minatonensis TaxID=298163 RepID=UPI00047B32E0|nr:SRPBCC domain-containing protein [Patulibacter minatonensis]
MIDVTEQIDAVERRVGRRTTASGEVHVLSVEQSYATTADDLWDACTNPERIPRWFLPVEGRLAEGGRYQLQGNAGGTIESCDAPRTFTATWEFGGATSRIVVRVEAEGGDRARLVLEHHSDPADDTWVQYGPGATGIGWDLSVLGLALHLSPGGALDPAEAAAWAGEDDGLRFLRVSGESWHDADVQGGADPAEARRRADRTIAAYTTPQD